MMMIKSLLVLISFIPLAYQQQQTGCTTCSSSSNYDSSPTLLPLTIHTYTSHNEPNGSRTESQSPQEQQYQQYQKAPSFNSYSAPSSSSSSYTSDQAPGYVPNYQGDQFTSQSRREETLRLNQQFWSQQQGGSSSSQSEIPPRTFSKNLRQIPIVFADPDSIQNDEPFFIEIDDDDLDGSFYSTMEPEVKAKDSPGGAEDYVNFDIHDNGEIGPSGYAAASSSSMAYETEATRAMVEALKQHDPKYVPSDLKLEFVTPSSSPDASHNS